jgi:5'-3' exonuclease
MRNEVRIIVVFDGPSPKLKSVALAKRAVARRQQREKGIPEEEPPLDNVPLQPKAFRPMNVSNDTFFGQYCNEVRRKIPIM